MWNLSACGACVVASDILNLSCDSRCSMRSILHQQPLTTLVLYECDPWLSSYERVAYHGVHIFAFDMRNVGECLPLDISENIGQSKAELKSCD